MSEMKPVLLILFSLLYGNVYSQEVKDPVRDRAKDGQTYRKWVVDINHDGLFDIMVDEKPSEEQITKWQKEIEPFPEKVRKSWESTHAFVVYLPTKDGLYKIAAGIEVDASHCYVGYIKELKQFGIVTIEYDFADKVGRQGMGQADLKKHLLAYTIHQNRIIETPLTPSLAIDARNEMETEYLDASQLTRLDLQEVPPLPSK